MAHSIFVLKTNKVNLENETIKEGYVNDTIYVLPTWLDF